MAELDNLSVSEIAELRREAGEFQTHADDLQGITERMFSTVADTANVWSGRDQAAYSQKFDGLRNAMGRIYTIIADYNKRLNDIATTYQQAQDSNIETVGRLQPDVDLV